MPRSWPALIIGVVVLVYWVRVILMVRRARRKAGHNAAFVPREKLGRMLRLVWGPVIWLWILLPLLKAFLNPGWEPRRLRPLFHDNAVSWAAAGLGVLALVATFICWRKMGTSWRMGINPNDKTQLISTGPYAYVRHPIYALSSLLMLCTMVIVPTPVMFIAGVLHLLLLQWEARREEKYMISVHGEEYVGYARRTGRFVPKLFGRVPAT